MTASGVSVDKASLALFFKGIEGKTIPEVVVAGQKKLVVMPSGGGAARPAAAGGPVAAAVVEEVKKEEVEDVDMGGLFGDEDEY